LYDQFCRLVCLADLDVGLKFVRVGAGIVDDTGDAHTLATQLRRHAAVLILHRNDVHYLNRAAVFRADSPGYRASKPCDHTEHEASLKRTHRPACHDVSPGTDDGSRSTPSLHPSPFDAPRLGAESRPTSLCDHWDLFSRQKGSINDKLKVVCKIADAHSLAKHAMSVCPKARRGGSMVIGDIIASSAIRDWSTAVDTDILDLIHRGTCISDW
jgi:hypothetical protein